MSSRRAAVAITIFIVVSPAFAGKRSEKDGHREDFHQRRLEETRQRIVENGWRWQAGMTSLSRFSESELDAMFAPVVRSLPKEQGTLGADALKVVSGELPTRFDWRDYGAVSSAKMQGTCGACWVFAAVAALESAVFIHEGLSLDLSEQQFLSCESNGYGCIGGWSPRVWEYAREHGAVSESCMPYEGDAEISCTEQQCLPLAVAGEWDSVANGVKDIKAAVHEVGPVQSAVYADTAMSYYLSGCFEEDAIHEGTNHSVLIVGWDDDACDGDGAWIVKNSWGEDWGNEGFALMRYGTANIGFDSHVVHWNSGRDIELTDVVVDDAEGGDGDAWLDPGEEARIVVELQNGLLADTGVHVEVWLESQNGKIQILESGSRLLYLAPGEALQLDSGFKVALGDDFAIGESVAFELVLDDGSTQPRRLPIELDIGDIPLLVVDDDSSSVADPFYIQALEDSGYLFRVHDTGRLGRGSNPSAEKLNRFQAVVWFTGTLGAVNPDEQAAIRDYVEAGGALLMSGQDMTTSLSDSPSFLEEVLHARFVRHSSDQEQVLGVDGDPIGDGLVFGLGGGDGARSPLSADIVAPLDGGSAALKYDVLRVAAVRGDDNASSILLGFGIETIDSGSLRSAIMERCLTWLAPDLLRVNAVRSPRRPGGRVTADWNVR